MGTLWIAVVLFLIAAVIGLTVWLKIMGNKPTNKAVALIHGLVAVIGFLMVLIFTIGATAGAPVGALILFAVAALGGLTLFVRDLMKTPGPKWLAVLHPLLAVVGLLLLLVFILGAK